jgi:hypothetical protein
MRRSHATVSGAVVLASILLASGCGTTSKVPPPPSLVVNSLEDSAAPPAGTVTLRSAVAAAASGETITFAPGLNGQTILLSTVGEAHSTLRGEVYSGMSYLGYQDRDYGASALYARKNLVIDASALPGGITIKWNGGDSVHARVLAVYGDLTLRAVTVTGGHSYAEAIASSSQAYTLARGGGLAVWGTLTLDHATVAGNKCTGDLNSSRDRGTYGGGIYANGLHLADSVVSGNSAIGYGAAGGGIYSVGGAENSGGDGNDTFLDRCSITGNRSTGEHSYGGGIFTLSGGPSNLATMSITNSTIARNLAEDHPDIPESGQYYDRGGGIYMGGGSLSLVSSTVVENAVTGHPATFSGSPNLGGGGIAATIGNAHTVENVWLRNSIVVGNTLNGAAEDWFVGSILFFNSQGYNLVGYVDFSRILVPVPDWMMASRKRWPEAGDHDGVTLAQALDVAGVKTHASVLSAGTDAGQPAVLWYPPAGMARDQIPTGSYSVTYVDVGYDGFGQPTDDFLNAVLAQVRTIYGSVLGSDFGTSFGDMTGTTWYGPAVTWPTNAQNANWIAFWRNLDSAIGGRIGMAGLNDAFWGTFTTGPLGSHLRVNVMRLPQLFSLTPIDQLGAARPSGGLGDIGSIER